MQCGRLAVSPARLTPDDAEAAAQRDRLARAIATLGAGWVGRASNDHPEAKFRALRAAPKAPRRRRSESDRAA